MSFTTLNIFKRLQNLIHMTIQGRGTSGGWVVKALKSKQLGVKKCASNHHALSPVYLISTKHPAE